MNKPAFLDKVKKPEKMPGKRGIVGIILVIAVVCAGLFMFKGSESVKYTKLEESQIPQQMTSQIIPEYRQLERALACVIDDKIYVFACRGEKPTSGYEIDVKKIKMTEKDGATKMVVYCDFSDPQPGNALSQVLTYPYQVLETDLTTLPDSIELRVQYLD